MSMPEFALEEVLHERRQAVEEKLLGALQKIRSRHSAGLEEA
eukprot:CAMPEP_0172207572 /NCGR_PEP_ID=MMETSP1050-20130122/33916_1 /TAXON_ID=233186 /ORGANISM="Cryptomonas curvata, Strain CCAP979/52" /LENGTH=41 /DNA_ID= /DNA_START= /DNA_END= /DNA_ORIENTATION=